MSGCEGRSIKRMTTREWVEGGVVLGLLLPFYFFFLPREGWLQWMGFAYLACIVLYIVFLSPHLDLSRQARRSLLEVPIIVVWILFWLWAVLPRENPKIEFGESTLSVCMVIGGIALGAALIHIIFISARLHGDSADDWGLGSPVRFIREMRKGPGARTKKIGVFLANVGVVLVVLLARTQAEEIVRKVVGQSTPFRLKEGLSFWTVGLISIGVVNLFLFCIVRYRNFPRAAKIVGAYLAILVAFIVVAGYLAIYVHGKGSVDLRVANGMRSVGTYIIWGTLQGLLFLSYFNTRIRKGISSPLLSALLTAVVFSLFHLTAYELMTVCFFIGIVWAFIFQAEPNVFLLGLAHGVSGGFGSAFDVKLPGGKDVPKMKATVGPFNV